MDWSHWEPRFQSFLADHADAPADPAHDLAHVHRVVHQAKRLAQEEAADLDVVVPAAWLHDCVQTSKDAPDRSDASAQAARHARSFLEDAGYPREHLDAIGHAIEAHSFSAGVAPRSLEAEVVQDADRLDALGAVGIARCFTVGGALGHTLHHPTEPLPHRRPVDDAQYTVDHFFAKLLQLETQMRTAAGTAEARRRTAFVRTFLQQFESEACTD